MMICRSFFNWAKYGKKQDLLRVLGIANELTSVSFIDLSNILRDYKIGSKKSVNRMIAFFCFIGIFDLRKGIITPKTSFKNLQDENDVFYKYCELFFKHNAIDLVIQPYTDSQGNILLRRKVPLEFSGFRDLSIEFHKLVFNCETNTYNILSSDFAKYLSKATSAEQLYSALELKKKIGEEGEMFVISYENTRLNGELNAVQISGENVSAGYDIKSYSSSHDTYYNRFIEVKTFTRNEKIYLTRNEVETAKILGDFYYLYLVDYNRINDGEYHPKIIKNVYNCVILNDSFKKEIEVYSISISEHVKAI